MQKYVLSALLSAIQNLIPGIIGQKNKKQKGWAEKMINKVVIQIGTILSILLSLILINCYIVELSYSSQNDLEPDGNTNHIEFPATTVPKLNLKDRMVLNRFLDTFKADDEKQYIPLGFYAMVNDIRDITVLNKLKDNGIILCHKYHSGQKIDDALLDLASVEQADLGVLQNLPRAHLRTKSLDYWEEHIAMLIENTQILVWYLPEETKSEDLTILSDIARIIRQVDYLQRPIITYIENSDADYISNISKITDAIVFGAYPTMTPWRPRADIRCRIDKAIQSGAEIVMAGLEAVKVEQKFTRPKDIRFDAYLSLISGAKGIMWYSYAQARQNKELLNAILKIATELNGLDQLGDIILNYPENPLIKCYLVAGHENAPPASAYENRSSSITRTYKSIQWTSRQTEEYTYIFAVNMNQKVDAEDDGGNAYRVATKFYVGNHEDLSAEVMFEYRQITVINGIFIDSFAPLETHIYRIKMD